MNVTADAHINDWLQLIRTEYLETPDLRLTKPQVERLWASTQYRRPRRPDRPRSMRGVPNRASNRTATHLQTRCRHDLTREPSGSWIFEGLWRSTWSSSPRSLRGPIDAAIRTSTAALAAALPLNVAGIVPRRPNQGPERCWPGSLGAAGRSHSAIDSPCHVAGPRCKRGLPKRNRHVGQFQFTTVPFG
jgi:hypothetical protein